MPIRKTISVDDTLNGFIQKIRGQLLLQELDTDYTTATNFLLALGIKRFSEGKLDELERGIINSFIHSNSLKWESILDQTTDQIRDAIIQNLPQIINQLAQAQQER